MTDKAPSPRAKSDIKNSCQLSTNVVQTQVETLVAREVDVHARALVDNLRKISRFMQILKDFKMKSARGISVLSLSGNTTNTVDIHTILFSGSKFLRSKFPGSKFLGSKFLGSKFLECKFPGCKFPGSKFPGSKFLGSKFPGSKFPGSKFLGSKFLGSKFLGCKFRGSKFPGSKFPGSKFLGSKFLGSKFPGSKGPVKLIQRVKIVHLFLVCVKSVPLKRACQGSFLIPFLKIDKSTVLILRVIFDQP